jgi:hypothetical protein
MANGEIVAVGGSGDELSVTVRAFTTGGELGISQVVMTNVRGLPVWSIDVAGCPPFVTEFVEHLSVSDAPLSLDIQVCAQQGGQEPPPSHVGPFLTPGPGSGGSVLECSPLRSIPPTTACTTAVDTANSAANDAQAACDAARRDRAERDADAAVAAAMYVAAVALAAAAGACWVIPYAGHIISVILLILAAIALIIAFVYTAMTADANSRYLGDLERFNNARQRYRSASDNVRANCCPGQGVLLAISDCTA